MHGLCELQLLLVSLEKVGKHESSVPNDDAFLTDVVLGDVDVHDGVVTERHGQRANECWGRDVILLLRNKTPISWKMQDEKALSTCEVPCLTEILITGHSIADWRFMDLIGLLSGAYISCIRWHYQEEMQVCYRLSKVPCYASHWFQLDHILSALGSSPHRLIIVSRSNPHKTFTWSFSVTQVSSWIRITTRIIFLRQQTFSFSHRYMKTTLQSLRA